MLKINESVNYQVNNNLQSIIAKAITGISFYYTAKLNSSDVELCIDLNEDDIEVVQSDNVIYCYLLADKINYIVDGKSIDDTNTDFVPNTRKVWRDKNKLYLLKINLNSGIIGRFDSNTETFRHQDINWFDYDPYDVIEKLLNTDYLQDYFSKELSVLKSTNKINESVILNEAMNKKLAIEIANRFISDHYPDRGYHVDPKVKDDLVEILDSANNVKFILELSTDPARYTTYRYRPISSENELRSDEVLCARSRIRGDSTAIVDRGPKAYRVREVRK